MTTTTLAALTTSTNTTAALTTTEFSFNSSNTTGDLTTELSLNTTNAPFRTTTTTTAINTTTALPTKEWTFPRIHIDALFGTTTTDMPAVLNKTIEVVDETEKPEDEKPTEGPNDSECITVGGDQEGANCVFPFIYK